MSKKLIFISMMIALYFVGIFSGIIIDRYFIGRLGLLPPPHHGGPGKGHPPSQMVDRLAKKLNLSNDQKEKVVRILEANKGTVDKYHEEFESQMKKTMDTVNESIRAILTDDQKKTFSNIIKEFPGPERENPDFHGKDGKPFPLPLSSPRRGED